jgi:hypothetical protein
MKKLLALILCVMMFVSVMSTSAFAAYDHTDQRVWRGEGQEKDIVDALKTNINVMYGTIAADNAVYKTVKSIDDIMKDLVDGMMENYAPTAHGTTQQGNVISDAVLAGLRATIGGEISDYLTKHANEYYTYDKHGNKILDPAKYAGVFAKAASGAISSKKAVAGIQSYMYYILQRGTYEQVAEQLFNLRQDMVSWGNWGKYGFDDLTYANPGNMHMPGNDIDNPNPLNNNIDGTMHGVNAVFQEFLTPWGMVGVDMNGDDFWDTGIGTAAAPGTTYDIVVGKVDTIGQKADGTPGDGSENGETPIWFDTSIPLDGIADAVAVPGLPVNPDNF